MARDVKGKRYKRKPVKESTGLPFNSKNYIIFGIGIFIIIIGYIALSRGPWDSFWSLTLAPILLVLGYCVIIPLAILYRKKKKKQEEEENS